MKKARIATTTDVQSTEDEVSFLDTALPERERSDSVRTIQSYNSTIDNTPFEHQKFSFRRESVTDVSEVAVIGEYGIGVTADGTN